MKHIIRRRILVAGVALATAAMLPLGAQAQDHKPKVELVMKSLANEFFLTMEDGAKDYQKQYSADFDLISNGITNETDTSAQIRIVEQMIVSKVDEAYVNGSAGRRLPHNLNISFAYVEGESVLMGLNKDVALSSGSACTRCVCRIGWTDSGRPRRRWRSRGADCASSSTRSSRSRESRARRARSSGWDRRPAIRSVLRASTCRQATG